MRCDKVSAVITNRWNQYLDKFEDYQCDIYYSEEYVKLYESEDGNAFCAVYEDNENILLMPFIRKEIDGYYDFETAYGYGGPISNATDEKWINGAIEQLKELFLREKYICGFIRFHPLLNNVDICKNHFPVLFDRNTVAINTEEEPNDIWTKQITSKNRNMIRKAERNELVYAAEYDFSSMYEFTKLYNVTMERLNAEEFYFFDENYYQSFLERFKGRAFLGTVRKDGELICAAIFMYSNKFGHYHLEGSNHAFSNMAANNLLLWKTAEEFHKLGVKEFHLGGGYNSSPDNSLLKFKKSFSNNMKEFYIGKWVFNEEKYTELKNRWSDNNPDKVEKYGRLLLCYRY